MAPILNQIRVFSLIKNSRVDNNIISDSIFAAGIAHNYEAIVDITDLPSRPDIGWNYQDEVFSAPARTQASLVSQQLATLLYDIEQLQVVLQAASAADFAQAVAEVGDGGGGLPVQLHQVWELLLTCSPG